MKTNLHATSLPWNSRPHHPAVPSVKGIYPTRASQMKTRKTAYPNISGEISDLIQYRIRNGRVAHDASS